MVINTLARRRTRDFFVAVAASLIIEAMGTAAEVSSNEYRESKGKVKAFAVEQEDKYLRIATYVRLRDGSIERPKVMRFQPHQTVLGVQRVEKGIRLFQISAIEPRTIFLPVSDSIDEYLLLVSAPLVDENKKVTGWTEWQLERQSARSVMGNQKLTIRRLGDSHSVAPEDAALQDQLRLHFNQEFRRTEEQMETPIRHDTKIPWWGR